MYTCMIANVVMKLGLGLVSPNCLNLMDEYTIMRINKVGTGIHSLSLNIITCQRLDNLEIRSAFFPLTGRPFCRSLSFSSTIVSDSKS